MKLQPALSPIADDFFSSTIFHLFFLLQSVTVPWMPASVCRLLYHTTVLFKVLYCKIRNALFIFCICFLCVICVKSIVKSIQFSSAAQSCPTLCDPMNLSTPHLPIHHQFLEFTQTHAHRVGDAIQPSHPLSSPSPPASNPVQHQGLFQ